MEILDLRHFSSADLRPLMEEEAEVWSRLLSWDYRGSTEMVLRYLDSRILPGYAAVDRGRVLGYAFFVYEATKGVVGDMFVSKIAGLPEGAVEEQLLRHSIETLQQSPGIRRAEAQLLLHSTSSVALAFLESGFRRQPRLFMVAELGSEVGESASVNSEIEIRPWLESDYHPTATLITQCYGNHIDSDINDQYRSLSGSLRFLHNIVRFPGCGQFDPESSFVAYNRALRGPVGAILCSRIRYDAGHVTQVCVLPEYRSHGIGEALMQRTSAALTQRGLAKLTLTVTQANEGAVHLYERLGFATKHVFDAFVWEMS